MKTLSRKFRWLKSELGRTVEPDKGLSLIMVERLLKGVVLISFGVGLAFASRHAQLTEVASQMQFDLDLEAGAGFWRRGFEQAVMLFGGLSQPAQHAIAAGALIYGTLEWIEALGLWLRRRWAEYLVLVSTGAFLPLEIFEVWHDLTPVRLIVLVINLLIVAYLIWTKRLFQQNLITLTLIFRHSPHYVDDHGLHGHDHTAHHQGIHDDEDDDEQPEPRVVSFEEARLFLADCLRFEHYLMLGAKEIVVQNPTLCATTHFSSEEFEIAELSRGLREHLPSPTPDDYWFDELRQARAAWRSTASRKTTTQRTD